jgi:hypothetical protein
LSRCNEKRLQRLFQGLLDMKSREFSLAAGQQGPGADDVGLRLREPQKSLAPLDERSSR